MVRVRRAIFALASSTAAISALVAACSPIVGIGPLDVAITPAETTPDADPPVEDASPPVADVATPEPEPDVIVEKRVFVTSTATTGVLNGENGADSRCIAAADRIGLGGDWVAWLSTRGRNAIDRVAHDGPFVRLDGVRVVRNKAQLVSGMLTAPISVTEEGIEATGAKEVWTGTLENGLFSTDCDGWTTSNALIFGAAGDLDQQDRRWTDNGGPGGGFRNWGCQTNGRLYCFEQ